MSPSFRHTRVMDAGCLLPEKSECLYASCYCEENVYKLVSTLKERGHSLETVFAVFISNKDQCVPLWRQSAGREEDGLVVWVGMKPSNKIKLNL